MEDFLEIWQNVEKLRQKTTGHTLWGRNVVRGRWIAVATISSEWWGVGGRALSGVQGQSPWSGDQRGSPPEAEKKLNFDNTKPL